MKGLRYVRTWNWQPFRVGASSNSPKRAWQFNLLSAKLFSAPISGAPFICGPGTREPLPSLSGRGLSTVLAALIDFRVRLRVEPWSRLNSWI